MLRIIGHHRASWQIRHGRIASMRIGKEPVDKRSHPKKNASRENDPRQWKKKEREKHVSNSKCVQARTSKKIGVCANQSNNVPKIFHRLRIKDASKRNERKIFPLTFTLAHCRLFMLILFSLCLYVSYIFVYLLLMILVHSLFHTVLFSIYFTTNLITNLI